MMEKSNFSVYCWALATLLFVVSSVQGCDGGSKSSSLPRAVGEEAPSNEQSGSPLNIGEELLRAEPTGNVQVQLFDALRERLASELARRGVSLASKSVRTAPRGRRSLVDDLTITGYKVGVISLKWTYKNQGDGNEDGIADINDIVPVATSFL